MGLDPLNGRGPQLDIVALCACLDLLFYVVKQIVSLCGGCSGTL